MPDLERRILAALTTLREQERGCERHMLVFPTSLMNELGCLSKAGSRVVVLGEATMVCRDELRPHEPNEQTPT